MTASGNPEKPPVGRSLAGWVSPETPPYDAIAGEYCVLEPLRVEHAADLWRAYGKDRDDHDWTYLPDGPYADQRDFAEGVRAAAQRTDAQFYAIVVAGQALGECAHLRINPAVGSIEVGHIHLSPTLQRQAAATEAMYLMMRRAFESGYRRYEWKCDALNKRSRRAAQRLGFSYEGITRNAIIVKGRNRDTAWYACIDDEWPALRVAFDRWLAADNFDGDGVQRVSLTELTAPVLVSTDGLWSGGA